MLRLYQRSGSDEDGEDARRVVLEKPYTEGACRMDSGTAAVVGGDLYNIIRWNIDNNFKIKNNMAKIKTIGVLTSGGDAPGTSGDGYRTLF